MIIYGWKTKTINQTPIEYKCKKCEETNAFLVILAHFTHVFWIPLFPYKKSVVIFCGSCGNAIDENYIPEENRGILKRFKSSARIPIYLFTGLILIVLAISYLYYDEYAMANRRQAYLADPQIGDVYFIFNPDEKSEFQYSFLKVNDIVGDSLWVSPSSYSYNGIVSQLDPKDGFYNAMYPIHKTLLKTYEETGELKKVFREYSSKTGFEREIEYYE